MTPPAAGSHPSRRDAALIQAAKLHLLVFGVVALVVAAVNLLTDSNEAWVWWLILGWAAVLLHLVVTVVMVRMHATDSPTPAIAPEAAAPGPFTDPERAALVQRCEHAIDGMRKSGRRIQDASVRRQALSACTTIERVYALVAAPAGELTLVRDVLDHLVLPAWSLLERYAALESRAQPDAEASLAAIRDRELPAIAGKAELIYDRLLRGTPANLQVVREMLAVDSTAG